MLFLRPSRHQVSCVHVLTKIIFELQSDLIQKTNDELFLEQWVHCSICQSTPSWQDLMQFRTLYQSLPPDEAANLLNTCCSTGIAIRSKRRIAWKLMGHRVCAHRLMKLLGTSHRSFYDNCKGELDMRCLNGRLPTSACLSVDRFLLEHWHYNSLN